MVAERLPALIKKYDLEFVVCNGENAAGGSGITPAIYNALLDAGVDVITMGDHVFRRKQAYEILGNSERILRPANLPPSSVGRGWTVVDSRNIHCSIAVISLIGQLNISSVQADSPWLKFSRLHDEMKKRAKILIVDFHGEATSEKVGMGWYCNGKASIVFGTHTHVPTADVAILDGGTAFISDVGMTGPYDSVLGRRKDRVLKHMATAMPHKFDVATGDPRLYGLLCSVDTATGTTVSARLIRADGGDSLLEFPAVTPGRQATTR